MRMYVPWPGFVLHFFHYRLNSFNTSTEFYIWSIITGYSGGIISINRRYINFAILKESEDVKIESDGDFCHLFRNCNKTS